MKDSNIIGVQEKRELAKIIGEDFEGIITQLQQEIRFTEGEILEQAHKKFGIKAFNLQITQLKKQIEMLEKQKIELGFDMYDKFRTTWQMGGSTVDNDSKAGRYYYLKVSKHADIQALNKERTRRLKNLWLTEKRSEVKAIAIGEIKVKLIEHKK